MLASTKIKTPESIAGKLFNQGGSAKECLQYYSQAENQNDVKDSKNDIVHEITHGMSTQPSIAAAELVNPSPKTFFQQKLLDKNEQLYASKCTPLGQCRKIKLTQNNRCDTVPDQTQCYGIPTELDVEAGEIINPRKTRKEVLEEIKEGHGNYVVTHHDYDVGEMYDRKYDWGKNNPRTTRFGVETPHYNDGRTMAETLTWMHKTPVEKTTLIVSKRVDDFRNRTQPRLGQAHDPIADTMNTEPDHTFGLLIAPDKYGVGDLLHMRSPRNYLLGKDRKRGVLSIVRQHLKKANYHNFSDLKSAFKHYDHDNKGYLDAQNIRDACWKFNLPIDNQLLSSLMHYCTVDEDSDQNTGDCKLDYVKFVNFLNWKDKFADESPTTMLEDNKEEIPLLRKQIDLALTNHMTTSSAISATVGNAIQSAKEKRTFGVPTVRSDVPAPRVRRISDHTNYGDEYDAYGLVNPSTYTKRGVFERDFFEPRTRDEIRKIFDGIGVKMSDEGFEKIWKLAVKWDSSDEGDDLASVEAFRVILDKIQGVTLSQQ